MTDIDRRSLIGGLVAAGGAVVATAAAAAAPETLDLANLKKEADVACLYHCDFGDPPRFNQMITNISNHYSVYGNPLDVQIVTVVHGQGVKFFLEDLEGTTWKEEVMVPKLFERVSDVAKNGLKVYLCEITFTRLKIDKSKARKDAFVKFVPSGVATVADLQAKGFGYLKVG